MATQALVSVAEYLKSAYSPDCDYVDGVVEERPLGERDHAWIQTQIATFIMSRFRQTGIAAIVEWRFQTSPTRFRIPDVVVVRGKPEEQILTTSPLLCIEILSPDDRISKVNARIKEYLDFGVPAVWMVDPMEKRIWVYHSNGMNEEAGSSIKVEGTDLEIPRSEIFD
jgi:Uma2 family endonuclease